MKPESSASILLTRDELAYLMKLWKVDTVPGMDFKPGKPSGAARQSLEDKKILKAGSEQPEVQGRYKAYIDAVLKPERVLIVVRDLVGTGRQLLVFSMRGSSVIMHSMPQEDQHRLAPMGPETTIELLEAWFPTAQYEPAEPVSFVAGESELEWAQKYIQDGNIEGALKSLRGPGISDEVLMDWIQAVKTRRFSGSFAAITMGSEEEQDAETLALLAGEQSAWMMLQQGARLRVLRANAAFQQRIRQLVRWLFDHKKKQFHSFILNIESLAFCLAAINRTDLAYKLLALEGETDSARTDERLQAGATLLVALGLCSVSTRGIPILDPELERAVFPLVKFDSILQARIERSDFTASARLYVQKRGWFTAHIVMPRSHIIESGKTSDLIPYLDLLLTDFPPAQASASRSRFSIALDKARDLTSSRDPEHQGKILSQLGLTQSTVKSLAEDLKDPLYRARLSRLELGSNSQRSEARNAAARLLMLLKGLKNSWVFSFPSDQEGSVGQGMRVDHTALTRVLKEFTAG